MVKGVINYSSKIARKKTTSLPEPTNQRPTNNIRLLFAPQTQTLPTSHMLPMPKALKASLSVYDGKSEQSELIEDMFRNNIKMFPHLTEIQKKATFTHYSPDFITECNEEPSQDWQRRWNVWMILRTNARHHEWITESLQGQRSPGVLRPRSYQKVSSCGNNYGVQTSFWWLPILSQSKMQMGCTALWPKQTNVTRVPRVFPKNCQRSVRLRSTKIYWQVIYAKEPDHVKKS